MYTPSHLISPTARPSRFQLSHKAGMILSAVQQNRATLIIPSISLIEIALLLSRINNNPQFAADVLDEIRSFEERGQAEIIELDETVINQSIVFSRNHKIGTLYSIIGAIIFLDHPATVVTTNQEMISSLNKIGLDLGTGSLDRIDTIDFANITETLLRSFLG